MSDIDHQRTRIATRAQAISLGQADLDLAR
jgi:hypothetical protein